MSNNKNGKAKQDAILNQFKRDARSNTGNSATAQAIKAGKELKAIQEAKALNEPKKLVAGGDFIFGSPAHIEYMESVRRDKSIQSF